MDFCLFIMDYALFKNNLPPLFSTHWNCHVFKCRQPRVFFSFLRENFVVLDKWLVVFKIFFLLYFHVLLLFISWDVCNVGNVGNRVRNLPSHDTNLMVCHSVTIWISYVQFLFSLSQKKIPNNICQF